MPRTPSRLCSLCDADQRRQLSGDKLVGRQLLVQYSDGEWYTVVVVCYYPQDEEYKIVYLIDDGLETRKLEPGRYILVPRRRMIYGNLILEGSIIEFTYPTDGKRHRAMIYDYANTGERIKIAYLDEDHTDILKGNGWDYVKESPCIHQTSSTASQ